MHPSTSSPVPLPPIPTDPQAVQKLTAAQWKAVLDAPPADATRWVAAAARQGHSGRFHEDGLAVPRDANKALDCYRRGAEGGDFRGQYAYARMLAERGDAEQSLQRLRRVPLTATPSFLDEVGHLLSGSSDARFQAIGQEMLARAAQLRGA